MTRAVGHLPSPYLGVCWPDTSWEPSMTRPTRAARSALLIPALALAACAARTDRPSAGADVNQLADSAFADSTGHAARLDSTLLADPGPPYRVLALPDSVREFEMATPTGLAIRPAGACAIAVVDGRETAVHFFTLARRYLGSLFLGGHRRDALSSIGQISMTPDGRGWVWELGRRRLVEINGARTGFRVLRTDSITASMPPLAAIEQVAPDRLIENWMTPSIPVPSSTWASERLPLLRIVDTAGRYVSGLWRIADRPGLLFTHALNQGILARQGDTLWFAYTVSGQVLRGILNRSREPWTIADTVRLVLPRMFAPEAPQWFRQGTGPAGSADAEVQISGFGITGGGYLVVGQTISYPPAGDRSRLHIPLSAVTIYDHAGAFVRGWRTNGRLGQLAVGRGVLAITVDPLDRGDRQVRIYRLADVVPGMAQASDCRVAK